MDLDNRDNLTSEDLGAPKGTDKIASAIFNVLKPESKAQKNSDAVKASAAGNYWTLRPYLKNMIPIPQYIIDQVKGQGIAYFAVLQLPAQGVGASNSGIINQLKLLTLGGRDVLKPDPTSQAAQPGGLEIIGGGTIDASKNVSATPAAATEQIKKYLPYIIGAIILVIILYFVIKK